MNLNVEISPDDEQMLNDILDNGIMEFTKPKKSTINEEKHNPKHFINDNKSSSASRTNFIESANIKDKNDRPVKSSALRNLLNEIKSDNSSPSSSKSPMKLIYSSKASTVADSYRVSNNIYKNKDSTNKGKEVNFGDMKSDIKTLQEKIVSLEKKLFNKPSNKSENEVADNGNQSSKDEIIKEKPINLKSSDSNSFQKSNKSIDNFKVKIKSPSTSTSSLKYKTKASLTKIQMKVQENLFKSFSLKKENEKTLRQSKSIQNNSFCSDTSKNNNSLLRSTKETNKYSYRNTVKEWKEKYYQALKEHEITKSMLVKEKQKNNEIIKMNRNLERKSANFDNLNYRLNKLIDDNEKLLNQYEQSEIIRREQSKLIKTLQNEISILRRTDCSNNILGNLDISEDYLIDSKKFKQSLEINNNLKK